MDTLRPAGSLETPILSPSVHAILRHLCSDPCHDYGAVVELCETRGDCIQTVVCPACQTRFVIDDDELAELLRWTDADGHLLACGVQVD